MEIRSLSKIQSVRAHLGSAFRSEAHIIRSIQRYNAQTFLRQPWQEISGSFGDLGTLLPIMIALANANSISLSSTLIFSGLSNIFTGIFFGIPLPVQPMKAIAAIALRQQFSKAETMSGGLFVGAVIGFLSYTGLLQWFTKNIPIPVIKGIQMGTGLSLIMYSSTLLNLPSTWFSHDSLSLTLAFLAFLALLWLPISSRIPYALIFLLLGLLIVAVSGPPLSNTSIFNIWRPHPIIPSPPTFATGALQAGLGQIPLTALNSVIAVTFLATDLLPHRQPPSITSMGLSVMAMNLIGCWFGSMPVCHGSGGLAAQYRFGARSGASIIFLGLLKLLLGLFAGPFTSSILRSFPTGFLAVMVVAAGLELANVGESLNTAGARDLRVYEDDDNESEATCSRSDQKIKNLTDEGKKRRWAVMLLTIGGILAFRNDAIGFLAGILCHWGFKLQDRWASQREGRIRLGDERHGILPQEQP